ncbi:MAG: SDR family NAD(P)-dependent oxidoreductase [Pararhodobacter sp.]|nr:SDR family NAD(P)-dependent oxidoreductase [Pararhodobacter sp.]
MRKGGNNLTRLRDDTVPKGRVTVVTGGASGLGAATARLLRDHGAQVVVLDADTAAIKAMTGEPGLHAMQADVTDAARIEALFARIEADMGPVSALVCCAGIAMPGSVVRGGQPMPLAEFRRVIDVNLLGTLNCIRCAVPQMINHRHEADAEAGVIVVTASIAAQDGQVGQAAYAASKGGVAGMVLPLARELGDQGIRVMGIAPGVFSTPMTEELPERSREIVFSAVPPFPKRAGNATEFADLVHAILCNPMLNGDTIRLDGGLRMPARL